jgi:acetyl/propionyl-CoA carboxylase alpha subunit
VLGVTTNLEFLERLIRHPRVLSGDYDTTFVERHAAELTEEPADDRHLREAALLAAITADLERRAAAHGSASEGSERSRWRDALGVSSYYR